MAVPFELVMFFSIYRRTGSMAGRLGGGDVRRVSP
jgi:hypothetical protein